MIYILSLLSLAVTFYGAVEEDEDEDALDDEDDKKDVLLSTIRSGGGGGGYCERGCVGGLAADERGAEPLAI